MVVGYTKMRLYCYKEHACSTKASQWAREHEREGERGRLAQSRTEQYYADVCNKAIQQSIKSPTSG